ncbi:MAG: hypothetical protein IT437_00035 [Phycisphaerales bacterium]|nr:hypothetical protein [Phycisphaerales bacterium]
MFRRPLLYPRLYPWLLLAAALDVMLTWLILELGGQEMNVVARAAINAAGLPGMLLLKFCGIVLVIAVCEFVGRRNTATGLRLAGVATVITCIPVALSLFMIGELAWMRASGIDPAAGGPAEAVTVTGAR